VLVTHQSGQLRYNGFQGPRRCSYRSSRQLHGWEGIDELCVCVYVLCLDGCVSSVGWMDWWSY
jgi:hypothetical protein